MRKRLLLIIILAGIFFAGHSANLFSAPSGTEQKKSTLLDNDDLAKALAELGEETPEMDTETPSEPALAETESEGKAEPAEVQVKAVTVRQVEKEEPEEPQELSSKYSMMRHLSEADVQIKGGENGRTAAGVWDKDSFTFPNLKDISVRKEVINFPTGKKTGMIVPLVPKHVYRIRFNDVPPFSKINLQYKLQEPPESKVLNYMYLKVFVGKYELKRLQVSSKDDWLSIPLNVGAVSFLNQGVPVSFEFATNQASGLAFSFIPETE